MRRAFSFVAFVATLMAAQSSFAQTDEELEQAKKLFDAGATFYNGGNYAEAITEFQRAFAVVPNALFLYNISLAQSKIGLFKESRTTGINATHYEGMDPKTEVRNQARIASLGSVINSIKVTKKLATPVATKEPKEIVRDPDPVKKTSEQKKFGALGYTGIAFAVIGAGGLATAGIFANDINGQIPEYEAVAAAGNQTGYDDMKQDLENKQRVGLVMLGVGGVLAATGFTLILIDLLNDGESDSAAYVAPTKDGAQVGMSVNF